MFSGKACFSPSVDVSIRKAWAKNGGTVTHSKAEFRQAKFFFCSGPDDPWLNQLLSRSLVVRHASWILKCVSEEFLMPVGPYTLDDEFDPSRIEPSPSIPSRHIKSIRSKRAKSPSPLPAAPAASSVTQRTNVLKRPFAHEDQSLSDIITRPPKKPRIQEDSLDSDRTLVHLVPPFSIYQEKETETEKLRASHSSRLIESQPITPLAASPEIKSSHHLHSENGPRVQTLQNPSLRSRLGQVQYHDERPLIKQFEAHIRSHEPVLDIPNPKAIASISRPTKLTIEGHTSPDEGPRTKFWRKTRESYCGSGPIMVTISDLLQAQVPTVYGAIFTKNGTYQAKEFECHNI